MWLGVRSPNVWEPYELPTWVLPAVPICPNCHMATIWATHMAPTIFCPYGAHLTKRYHSHLAPMWVGHMGPISAHVEPMWGPETFATWVSGPTGKGYKKSKNSILTTAIGPLAVGNLWTYLLGRTSCCGKPLNVSAGPDLLLRETAEFICWAGVKPYVGFNLEFFFIDWVGLDAVLGAFQVRITHRVWLCCRASMCYEDSAHVSSLLVLVTCATF